MLLITFVLIVGPTNPFFGNPFSGNPLPLPSSKMMQTWESECCGRDSRAENIENLQLFRLFFVNWKLQDFHFIVLRAVDPIFKSPRIIKPISMIVRGAWLTQRTCFEILTCPKIICFDNVLLFS